MSGSLGVGSQKWLESHQSTEMMGDVQEQDIPSRGAALLEEPLQQTF